MIETDSMCQEKKGKVDLSALRILMIKETQRLEKSLEKSKESIITGANNSTVNVKSTRKTEKIEIRKTKRNNCIIILNDNPMQLQAIWPAHDNKREISSEERNLS